MIRGSSLEPQYGTDADRGAHSHCVVYVWSRLKYHQNFGADQTLTAYVLKPKWPKELEHASDISTSQIAVGGLYHLIPSW